MAKEMSESRKEFIDFMLDVRQQGEQLETKERISAKIDALQKELREIAERAYQAAIREKIVEYQEKANTNPNEIEAIQQERKEFEANPEAFGIVKEKSPIKDETDQKRALEIVELLKDTKQLGKVEETDFAQMIDGFGERHKNDSPSWLKGD